MPKEKSAINATYEPVIGLEVHVQLATQSKIFCRCSNISLDDELPNSRTCPICAGHPGTLPVLNRKVVEFAVKTGLATQCQIEPANVFARKHYYYPDLPKGFQISQYDKPICFDGYLEIEGKKIRIKRIHLEEDAGKNTHSTSASYIDLNRAGTPLIEVVSEPDLRSAKEAGAYLRELHAIVTCLGVCAGNLEDGNFRCDANVSIRPVGSQEFGTRTEIKNINSFRFVEKAIETEIQRQILLIERGDKIVQETRGYDSLKNNTYSMRSKEEAHDYRYFPEPDLIPAQTLLNQAIIEDYHRALPELPSQKRIRFMAQYALTTLEATTINNHPPLISWMESTFAAAEVERNKIIVNLLIGPVLQLLSEKPKSQLSVIHLISIANLLQTGKISHLAAKTLLSAVWETGTPIEILVKNLDLEQNSDMGKLSDLAKQVLANNPQQVDSYLKGKTKLLPYFVGQMMKLTGGKANPKLSQEILEVELKKCQV